MRKEFEKELTKQGFLFQETPDGYYNITSRNRIALPTKVQLVISKPINLIYHGTQNGNELDGIGYFHFSLSPEQSSGYHIFAFEHLIKDSYQYMNIPTKELRKRLMKNLIRYRSGQHLELRLWLLDGNLYDTTSMGCEGEWYYLSKGIGGRMIDQTHWNFTYFWNNWILGSREEV